MKTKSALKKVGFIFTGTVPGDKMAGTREIDMGSKGGGPPGGGAPEGGAPAGASPGGGAPEGGAPGGGAPGGGGDMSSMSNEWTAVRK